MIKPGEKLKYYKARVERVIIGWNTASASMIAKKYNVGDPKYSKKLTYVINEVFPKEWKLNDLYKWRSDLVRIRSF